MPLSSVGVLVRRTTCFFELSLYHYDTQDAVFSGPPIYSTSDVKTTGGELTFDYRASHAWHLQGGYSYSRGKKDGVLQEDFPESMANLSSHLKVRDDLIFTQSLYYTGERTIPSAYNPIPSKITSDLTSAWFGVRTKAWKSACSVAICLIRIMPKTCTTTSTWNPAKSNEPFFSALPKNSNQKWLSSHPDSKKVTSKAFLRLTRWLVFAFWIWNEFTSIPVG